MLLKKSIPLFIYPQVKYNRQKAGENINSSYNVAIWYCDDEIAIEQYNLVIARVSSMEESRPAAREHCYSEYIKWSLFITKHVCPTLTFGIFEAVFQNPVVLNGC